MSRFFLFRSSTYNVNKSRVEGEKRTRGRAVRTRLVFESLEDRALLTGFTVVSLADSGAGSLRQAVVDANAQPGADTIAFADGLVGTITLTGGQLSITDPLTIDGPGSAQIAVSGNHQSRIFNITSGTTAAISGLTISEGRASGTPAQGGGILNAGGNLALSHVVLSNNQAIGAPGRGGAIANLAGATLNVIDSLLTQNQGIGGNAGAVGNSGGIFNLGSRLTVIRSTFIGNQAIAGGGGQALAGGVANSGGSIARITDSTFVGNQAIAGDGSGGNGFGLGGGIYNNQSTLAVENSSILQNEARGGSNNTRTDRLVSPAAGGGIFNAEGATLVVTGSTIAGNRALGGSNNTGTGNGDVGTAFGGGMNNVGTATVVDSIVEQNEARGGSGNRGDGTSIQFVGTGTGGGIATSARSSAGAHVTLTLINVTLDHNLAVGGDGNMSGTFVDIGIGGGLANNGSNPFVAVSGGSEVVLQGGTVTHNRAVAARGAGLGGGIANTLGGVVTVSATTLAHNRAQGGDSGPTGDGGKGFGGGIYNDEASTHPSNPGAPTVLTIEASFLTANVAQGGSASGVGSRAGSGWGGGIWNGGTTIVRNSGLTKNLALGGDGTDGADGGDGLGGGVYNGPSASLHVERTSVSANHANGGGSDGQGVGGGIYNLGQFDFDIPIKNNYASTSNKDLFDSEPMNGVAQIDDELLNLLLGISS